MKKKKKICFDVRGLLITNTPSDVSLILGGAKFIRQVKRLAEVQEIYFCFWGGAGFRRLAKQWLEEFKPDLFFKEKILFCPNPNEVARQCQELKIDLVITANPKIYRALKGNGPPSKQAQCLRVKGVKNKPDFGQIFQNLVQILKKA